MKRILLTAGLFALSSTAAFALEPGCNRAIQNWSNGSKDTCPVSDAGHASNSFDSGNTAGYNCHSEKKSRKEGYKVQFTRRR